VARELPGSWAKSRQAGGLVLKCKWQYNFTANMNAADKHSITSHNSIQLHQLQCTKHAKHHR
jgi:hypothetical protein